MNGVETFKASNGVKVEMWYTADGCALKVDRETLVVLSHAQQYMLARWLVQAESTRKVHEARRSHDLG